MRDFSKRQCLVIDDFQGMRTLLRDMLRELGVARVDIAANGNEATGLLGGHRYDVVLCDYNLGNGRGYSVREVIAAAEQVTGTTISHPPALNSPRNIGLSITIAAMKYPTAFAATTGLP